VQFLEAAQAAIIETVRGTDVSFPPLSIGDYTPWCAELHNVRKLKSKSLIPKTAEPLDAFRMARIAEFDEPSLDAIAALAWTPAGATKILKMSLAKAGLSAADQDEVVAAIPPRRIVSLAIDVSGLFERRIPELDAAKGQPDPNAEGAGSEPAAGGEGTGL
jgi:hypothetical protein